ncbi:MAG: acetate/propionate family kinase [Xanthomonadaceae bacterium]|nr:acetate/propionate family kinase [Xanthomonadaceae bacterium]
MTDAILVLNAGSSSIKFALFEIHGTGGLVPTARGEVERLESTPHFVARDARGETLGEGRWSGNKVDFRELLEEVIGWAEARLGDDALRAVGHRVVHGGTRFVAPCLVTPEVLDALDALTPLAPLHQPHNLAPIRAITQARPRLPQVACFDTAFHHAMPRIASLFALPRALEGEGVRRYGFHGLSYEYIAQRLLALDPRLASGRLIAAHLGNGASLCAMHAGRSVDTTMGFTALDGLVMGTRCGDLDPGVVLYLERQRGMDAQQVEQMLYRESGLLGVSGGIASDMRTLLASNDPHAREAVELFAFRAAREVGALASSLGGVDGIVFTAGIGEHAPPVRAMVCERLAWLGVALDAAANAADADVISSPGSQIQVRVIPTDEEGMIARHALDAVSDEAR